MSWRRGRTGLELVLPFEREKWFGEKKASRMMETFLLLHLLLLLLGCHLLLHRSDGEGGGRRKKKPNCHLHRLGREFTLDVADLKSVVGARWLAVSPSSQERSRLVTQLPATTRAHILLLLLLSGRRDDGRTHTHTRGLPKSPSRP